MADLFDALDRRIDITAPPTLEPRLTPDPRPGVITSPFAEPARSTAIAKTVAAAGLANKAAALLEHVKAAGTLGLSDADLAIKMQCTRSTVCSTRNHVRTELWIARRVHGGLGVDVIAWRLASPYERGRNDAHERQLEAAGQRWSPIKPPAPKKPRGPR